MYLTYFTLGLLQSDPKVDPRCTGATPRNWVGAWMTRLTSLLISFFMFLLMMAGSAHATETVQYQYDELGRLKTVSTTGTVQTNGQSVTTTYDPAGNRITYVVSGVGGGGGSPTISVGPASANEGVALSFPVTLSSAQSAAVTVNYSTTNGTAIAPTNYTATSGTLSIPAGTTSGTITVATRADGVVSGSLTMTIGLTAPVGATLGTMNATGTIFNTDSASNAIISIASASANEGSPLSFSVTRTGTTTNAVTANWVTNNGTALAGTNYTSSGGTVSFAAGVSSATIAVPTIRDNVATSDLGMTVTLSGPSAGASLGMSSAPGIIVNIDSASNAILSIAAASANEGSPLSFLVTRTGTTTNAVTANWATSNGTAIAGTNYSVSSGTISLAAGVTSATIIVPTIQDGAALGSLSMNVTLSLPSTGASLGTSAASGTISNTDVAIISIAGASSNEGSPLTFAVTRSGAANNAVSTNWATSNGTAVAGTNYTASSGTVSFAAGATSANVTVPTIRDNVVTGNLTTNVTLSGPSLGSMLGASAAVGIVVNIDSNNQPPVAVSDGTLTLGKCAVKQITITANDTDPEGNYPITLVAVVNQSNYGAGTADVFSSTQIQYIANDAAGQTDVITYTIKDSLGATSSGTLPVSVTAAGNCGLLRAPADQPVIGGE